MHRVLSLFAFAAAVVITACQSSGGQPVAATPADHALAEGSTTEQTLRSAAATDLPCAHVTITELERQRSSESLYVIDGCGQRALYVPQLQWPGPSVVGFVLVSKFAH